MWAIFKFNHLGHYFGKDAIKIYARKSNAEKYCDRLNNACNPGPGEGFVVRPFN